MADHLPENPTIPVDLRPASIEAIHHVALSVSDVPAAVEWYRSRFQCSVRYQDPTWALLDFANLRLALVVPEQHPPHICVERASLTEFPNVTVHRDGSRSVYIHDPWGNAIELLEAGTCP